MAIFKNKIGKQGTWSSALVLLVSPIFIVFSMRWMLYEPFVIPSGSMEPNLFAHDHIFVKKFSYGIRYPIGDGWLVEFGSPKRGDVIVFRYPENRKIFFIKRLIGLPGDVVKVQGGRISINGTAWSNTPADGFLPEDQLANIDNENSDYFLENTSENDDGHFVKFNSGSSHVRPEVEEFKVPAHSYFVMGDNRDQSHDSRFWGFVDHKLLVGEASFIWLSCDKTLDNAPMICDPTALRPRRMFIGIN